MRTLWALSMRETTSLEIKLKLYHAQGLGLGRQQFMAEPPAVVASEIAVAT